ncbi:hypothetical protein FBU30_011307 [Linnemannia zychae]|nr:hypothetical protein FBU30_011307 [Linnemannia zychae]
MHHPSTNNHSSGEEDESSPLFIPSSSSATTVPSTPHTKNHTPSSSTSSSPKYQAISRSLSPGKNKQACSPSDPNLDRNHAEYSLPDSGSGSGSGSSTSSSSSEDEEELVATDHNQLQHSNPLRHHHHHPRHTRIQKMLAILAQLGLLVYFGTLVGVIAKAPWVYPYSWHPICMGLYGFIATEGILLLQPTEKGKQRVLARTVHGCLLSLALLSAIIGFVAIYVNKDRLGKVHFHTNHALLGSTAVFVFALQVLFGLAVAYAPRSLFRKIGHARITRIHRISGYISITLVWGTLWLAVVTNWVKKNFDHEWIFYLGLGMVAVGLVGQITPSRLYVASRRTTSS